LEEKCRREHLSLRQAATKTGLSHATIDDIIKGRHPSPETIQKLARGFGGDGNRGLALEDRLLVLAGYRREELSQAAYLKIIPLLSPEYQHIIEVLVGELAKIEGIKESIRK
ncbi:unnamed protein product, partial [marine sediment metagenome]